MPKIDYALALAARGLPVFPLVPFRKRPAIEVWQHAATTDHTQIKHWWGDDPNCNIGVCTTGFVVIDIDVRQGAHALANYQSIGGHFNTFTVRTASGGFHCYFTGPDSRTVAAMLLGLDVRSHGGYVVAPGSVTTKSDEDHCVDGEYEIVYDLPLAPVPLEIELLLKPPHRAERIDTGIELDKGGSIAAATNYLKHQVSVSEGGRNAAAYRIAAAVVCDHAISADTAYQLLEQHWNSRCSPPLPALELMKTISSATASARGIVGAALPEVIFNGVRVDEPLPAEMQAPHIVGVFMGNPVTFPQITARPWLVNKLLMLGNTTVLAGMGAAGKSILCLVFAAHWAVGKDFAGFTLKSSGIPLRTIIYNAEDDMMEQSRRLAAICDVFKLNYIDVCKNLALMDDSQGDLVVAAAVRDKIEANELGISHISNTIIEQKANVVIFDPLINIHRCNENDNAHMTFTFRQLRRIARNANASILVPDHVTKGSVMHEKGDPDSLRGAGAKINSARLAFILSTITKEDAAEFGLRDPSSIVRLDNAKTQFFKKTAQAMGWFEWKSHSLPTGDSVGVPVVFDPEERTRTANALMFRTIRDAIILKGVGAMTRGEAARMLKQTDDLHRHLTETSIRHLLERTLERPMFVEEGSADRLVISEENGEKLIRLI